MRRDGPQFLFSLFSAPSVPPRWIFFSQCAYNQSMHISAIACLSRAATSLLALCLLVNPLCSARCALATCLPASKSVHPAGSCHHSSTNSHAATSIAAASLASCQSTDSLSDALPVKQPLSLKSLPSPTLQFLFVPRSRWTAAISNPSSAIVQRVPDSSPGPLSPLTPLRL